MADTNANPPGDLQETSPFGPPCPANRHVLHWDAAPLPIPPAVEAIEDTLLRQHAREAWAAASRLKAVAWLWILFISAHRSRINIADESQHRVSEHFPELGAMQQLLDDLMLLPDAAAAVCSGTKVPCRSDVRPFPLGRLHDWIDRALKHIRQSSVALIKIGVNAGEFSPENERRWGAIWPVMEGIVDLSQFPPAVRIPNTVPNKIRELACAADKLLDLLRDAPAAALNAPRTTPAPRSSDAAAEGAELPSATGQSEEGGARSAAPTAPPDHLHLDDGERTATLDGTRYELTLPQLALIKALYEAGGLWRSTAELATRGSELDGVRIDRLHKKLPRALRKLIVAQRGRGYRLTIFDPK